MLGIVHHSPVVISVILDREHFKKQLVSQEEVEKNNWREKIKAFTLSQRDKRDRVLFVEKLDSLQQMLKSGFDPSPFKVVVYDGPEILSRADCEIVDAGVDGDTWTLYRLMPDRLNNALRKTDLGVPEGTESVDLSEPMPDLPQPKKARPKPVLESGDDTPLADADAVMKSILDGAEAKTPEPEPETDADVDPVVEEPLAEEEETAEEVEEVPDEGNGVDDEPEPEEEPEPAPEPDPKPKKKAKKKQPKTPKKKPAVESFKLF